MYQVHATKLREITVIIINIPEVNFSQHKDFCRIENVLPGQSLKISITYLLSRLFIDMMGSDLLKSFAFSKADAKSLLLIMSYSVKKEPKDSNK